MRIDIMVDLETLGLTADNPVIQIGALAFNLSTGEKYGDFVEYCKLDVAESGMFIDTNTYQWWLDENAGLLQQILAKGIASGNTEKQMIQKFVKWIGAIALKHKISKSNIHIWGNGMLFDNAIIHGKCKRYDILYPIIYQNDRDVRTIVDLFCMKSGMTRNEVVSGFKNASGLVQHDALNDCQIQFNMVKHCYDALVGK